MKTTYVERSHTNKQKFELANEKLKEQTADGMELKQIVPLAKIYQTCRMERQAHIFRLDKQHPVRFATLETLRSSEPNTLKPWVQSV